MKRYLIFAIVSSAIAINCDNCTGQATHQQTGKQQIKIKKTVMDKKDYTASIVVSQDAATAFNAVKNFRAWWSEEIQGNTDKLNEEFFYHYKDIHLCKMKLIEMVPNKKLVYLVTDNQFSFVKAKTEWIGTKLIFDIAKEGGKTKVQFTHEGLVPEYECYNVCFEAWTTYIKKSLYNLITTGKGEPNPLDGQGYNAKLAEKWKLK